ncbi:MAG: phage major capsid protein [Novosphingobium sp.]|nr:phage major capsid protein [Novosphingobium sp.]
MASYIDRLSASSLIPPEIAREIIQGAVKYSTGMQIFKRARNMTTNELIMPALSMLPSGGWLSSDNAIKPLTQQAWERVEMYAEEYAARVIIPDNVREDASYDMWGEIIPRLQEVYGKAFDAATFMGIDKPAKFRSDIVTACIQAGAVVNQTTNLVDDINNAMKFVEESGYNPTSLVAGVGMKSIFRKMAIDTVGQPIKGSWIDGLNKYYLDNGAWDSTRASMIVGDFSQAIYSVREDMNIKISADAATNMTDGLHSMFDEDSQVLRSKWRVGFAIPNPINILSQTYARFPFAIISASTPVTTYTITFTLTDSNSDAVANAYIKCGGMEAKTNASGVAVFKSQANQTYDYVIKVAGKVVKKDVVSVVTSNVAVTLTV